MKRRNLDSHRATSLAVALILVASGLVYSSTLVATEPKVAFEHDIVPVLTKLGCNSGACHGAAIGRGGFKLSLYGSQPSADYDAIVRQLQSRRINLGDPGSSLLLAKPTESIAHGGGYLIEDGSSAEQLLLDWIRQGASQESQKSLERVRIIPERHVFDAVGESVPIRVWAQYSDGSGKDVSEWVVLKSEDQSAVKISEGVAKALRPGRHIVIARYLNEVRPIELIVPFGKVESDVAATTNFIDREVNRTLGLLGLPVAEKVAEHEFVRRVTLDLTGRLPAAMDHSVVTSSSRTPSTRAPKSFLRGLPLLDGGGNREALETDSASSRRRQAYVDHLLASEECVEYWTLQFSKLFRLRPGDSRDAFQGVDSSDQYHQWIAQQLQERRGYDEIARALILAKGDTREYGPANFYRTVSGPREQAEFFSELFMGNRLRCANCHNHPLDRWTQDDYHGLAAIFARVEMGDIVELKPRGEVIHPVTLEPATPRVPGEFFLEEGAEDHRLTLANWLVGEDNPYFAKAIVNRLWAHLMGQGLIEPVDDLRATNPATHPALLEQLAEDFVAHDYDLWRTLRLIVSSDAYLRRGNWDAQALTSPSYYSYYLRKPLQPEVLADAISDVLDVPDQYGGEPLGTRAVALMNPRTPSRALDVLGRCDREDGCEGAVGEGVGLPAKLHLINGPLLNARIDAQKGRLHRFLDVGMPPLQIVGHFYEIALNRDMKKSEREFWELQLRDLTATAESDVLEDFLWALLTSEEFITNH